MMRDMGEKTAQMDRHLTRVSSTMVEFVSGISVVKAFGTVGRSHERFTRAAEDFSRFYRDWCGPLLKGSALGQASVSPSLILLISTAGGAAFAAAGIVSPVQVITCALIALVIPAAIEVLGTTAWSYQIAGRPRCGSWICSLLIHCPPRGIPCQTDRMLRLTVCPSPTGRPSRLTM